MTKPSVHSIVLLAEHSDNPAIQKALQAYNEAFDALTMLVKLSDADDFITMLNSENSYDRIKVSMELRRRQFERDPEAARAWMMKVHPNLWNPDGSLKHKDSEEDDK